MTTVLITGTSSGIGRATALRLARRSGLTVYATARKVEALADLVGAGCRVLPLDVTDEASMTSAVATIEAESESARVDGQAPVRAVQPVRAQQPGDAVLAAQPPTARRHRGRTARHP